MILSKCFLALSPNPDTQMHSVCIINDMLLSFLLLISQTGFFEGEGEMFSSVDQPVNTYCRQEQVGSLLPVWVRSEEVCGES